MFYGRADSDKKFKGPSGFDCHPRDLGNFYISLYIVRAFTSSSVIFARTVINTLTDACLFNAVGSTLRPRAPTAAVFISHPRVLIYNANAVCAIKWRPELFYYRPLSCELSDLSAPGSPTAIRRNIGVEHNN